MKPGTQFKRRGFIGAALVGAGGALGWLMRSLPSPGASRSSVTATTSTSRFAYDISEFERTDPALLRFTPGHQFETGFNRVKRICAAPNNRVWVAGDRAVKLFAPDGTVERQIELDRPPHCIHVGERNELFAGLANFFEVYDAAGTRRLRSPRLGEASFLTSIAVHEGRVYAADAGRREVLICDAGSGAVIDRFGKRDRARNNPGFAVPSPYFDLALAADGLFRIVNPGRLRVETYSREGNFQSSWGEPGMRIDRFCGCCNPVYFSLTPAGDFITSEKGLARINIYGPDGTFKGAVAGPDALVQGASSSERSKADRNGGAAFDVAVDVEGRVLALDPIRNVVRYFVPFASA